MKFFKNIIGISSAAFCSFLLIGVVSADEYPTINWIPMEVPNANLKIQTPLLAHHDQNYHRQYLSITYQHQDQNYDDILMGDYRNSFHFHFSGEPHKSLNDAIDDFCTFLEEKIRRDEAIIIETKTKGPITLTKVISRCSDAFDYVLEANGSFYTIKSSETQGEDGHALVEDILLNAQIINADWIFSDLPPSHPNHTAITYIKKQQIVEGYPDGTFRPDNNINRAEFTKIIIGALYEQEEINQCIALSSVMSFPDVPVDAWFAPYTCAARKNEIINGYPDGTFKPAENVNAAEAAKILSESFNLKIKELGENEKWFEPYMNAFRSTDALPSSITDPAQKITRGEMAEMIYRLHADP